MKTHLIKTAEQLYKLQGKSVWVESWKRHCSVAWLQNMSFVHIMHLLRGKQIYGYKPKKV